MYRTRTCQVEDPKRALILFGGKTSQVTKDVLSDLHKLKTAVMRITSIQHLRSNTFQLGSLPDTHELILIQAV